jgi:hypothetical protein
VRVEIMGSQKCGIVGKYQSVLIMINLILFTRTRRYGVIPKDAKKMMQTVEENADSMLAIVEAYMLQCEAVQDFYGECATNNETGV